MYIDLPKRAKNIKGQRFGRLVALGPIKQDDRCRVWWFCKCDCGNTTTIIASDLSHNGTKSCGCITRERLKTRNTTHGLRYSRFYNIWCGIIQRCTNPNDKAYHNYGGRGIYICDKWRDSFEEFYKFVKTLPNHNNTNYSLDRIDNDDGYKPGNIHFATATEQSRNCRTNRLVTYQNTTKCLTAWAEEFSINPETLAGRLDKGWGIEKALTKPIRQKHSERKSKHRGIYWHALSGRWRVQLKIGDKRKTLSGFNSETEALLALILERKNVR